MIGMLVNNLIIVGAGPFGISLAILAKNQGMKFKIFGKPGEFFRETVPGDMLLRSFIENHIDPLGKYTIEYFLSESKSKVNKKYPISSITYVQYLDWIIDKYSIQIEDVYVDEVSKLETNAEHGTFKILDDNGLEYYSEALVVAIGQKYFNYVPDYIANKLPTKFLRHSSQINNFTEYKNKSVLIVGGRQSAFEWAALSSEAGADQVHLVYRHNTPKFKNSELIEWVEILKSIESLPTLCEIFSKCDQSIQEDIKAKFFSLGRAHIEGWLEDRINKKNIYKHEHTIVSDVELCDGEQLMVSLSDGTRMPVNFVISATGYKPDLSKLPFLKQSNLLNMINHIDGSPILNTNLESNIKGLYFTSSLATYSHGPYFNLTMPACSSAKIIISNLIKH